MHAARVAVNRFVIDAQTSCRAGGGMPVDGHPSEDFVVGPGVLVDPVVELLVDPCEEAGGAVGEGVG